jgi:site-specific DNA-methyltransferase (adenine-specific)
MAENVLYYGDNLDIVRRYIKDESVDLVYLDPPFKSEQNYDVLFAEQNGSRSSAQIRAFDDTWRWDQAAAEAYDEKTTSTQVPQRVSIAIQSFRNFLGDSDMTAYLCMMAPRLLELHRVLKPTGSIYLHCDPTASHYLKVLMDAVFGAENFRREVVWRSGWISGFKARASNWARNHDTLLYYLKDARKPFTFNKELAFKPHPSGYARRGGGGNPRGVALDDVWDEVALYSPWIKSFSTEKLGYATQKPLALLERIIQVCSREGDLVLDPFCGCGTAVIAAERLKRNWIGIDITHLAMNLIKHRLKDAFGDSAKFKVVGEPVDISGAANLAAEDPYQFQWWALGLDGARPADLKKGADKGIDGKRFFNDEAGARTKQIVYSVKAGRPAPAHVRDLHGVLDRVSAAIGVLICMEEPSQQMRAEAASAGFYDSPGWHRKYPKLQILTIAELLGGKRVECPPSRYADATFKKAPCEKIKRNKSGRLGDVVRENGDAGEGW